MRRVLSWIANLGSIALGGSIVSVGDPPLELSQADADAPRWAARLAVLTPVLVVILILIGLPWPMVAIVAALLLLPLIAHRIRALRR